MSTLLDPRLREAAELIKAAIDDVATARTNGAVLHPEAHYRLAQAHDAVIQADRLLAGQPA